MNGGNHVVIFPAKGMVEVQQQAVPELKPGHILCRTRYSGISNGTERNQLMGGNYGGAYPTGIGYQKVGEVIAVGDGLSAYRVGDVVFSGTVGKHSEYFMENVSEPEGERNLVMKLPAGVDEKEACLLGVAGVAMHDVRRCGVKPGERVLVVGAGLIGLFTAQCAAAAGATVTICNRDPSRLEAARAVGIESCVSVAEDAGWDALRQSGGFDVVFETSAGDVLDQVIGRTGGPPRGMIRPGGRLALIGGRFEIRFDANCAQFQDLTIISTAHFRRPDLLALMDQVISGKVRVAPFLREVVPIAQAERIYARLRDEPRSLLGTVFDWT